MQDLKRKKISKIKFVLFRFFFYIHAERSRCSFLARLKKENQMYWHLTSRKILLILFIYFFKFPSLTDVYTTRWADSSLFLAFKQGQKLKGTFVLSESLSPSSFSSLASRARARVCICVRVHKERLMYCLMFWLMDAPRPLPPLLHLSADASLLNAPLKRVSIDHGRKKYNNLA